MEAGLMEPTGSTTFTPPPAAPPTPEQLAAATGTGLAGRSLDGAASDIGGVRFKIARGHCAKCGEFPQMRIGVTLVPADCPSCNQTQEETDARGRAHALAREAGRDEYIRREKRLAALAVPPMYRTATLGTFEPATAEQADALARARRYLAAWPERQSIDFPQISIFTGRPGSGKGHIAWSLAKAVVTEYGDAARFVVLSDCIRDLRDAWNAKRGDTPEGERLVSYRTPDLLVIDEVSTHAFFGQPTQHLYDIVAWREVRFLPTILTTNDDKGELAELLGPALVSRAGGYESIWRFGDADYRRARREARRRIGDASAGRSVSPN